MNKTSNSQQDPDTVPKDESYDVSVSISPFECSKVRLFTFLEWLLWFEPINYHVIGN